MKTIEQYIETEMSGKISKKRNSPLAPLTVLAVGIVLLVLLRTLKMGDSLSAGCLTVGMIATAVGFILTAMNFSGAMTHYVYLPTRSRMREKKVYVGVGDYRSIVDAIGGGDVQSLAAVHPVVSSNCAVRVIASVDGECALVQAVRDEGGRFTPETEVHLVAGASSSALLHLFK